MAVSRRQNTCLWEAINTHLQNVEHFGAQPTKLLPETWRRLSESRQLLGQVSRAQMEIRRSRILKRECLVFAKQHFPRLLFSSALKMSISRYETTLYQKDALCHCTRNLRPEVSAGHRTTKKKWPQSGAILFLVSEVNLARGDF